ncbi:MAG: radical SAM protein [Candidatus Pacearchaeota archaeon]|nr:radical SAM protein [Candidatus Pacearchaeota archaeon]
MDTKFHSSHESLTEVIYNTPGMLPSRYVFVITNLCNLKCGFCFQDRKPKKNAINAEGWISLTKELPEYARVTLTGGEPLVFPGFDKVFSYISNKFDSNIITNGILLTEKKIDYLLSFPKFKVLSISIDDIGNTTRDLREEQWNHLKEMMKYFVKKRNEIKSEALLDVKTMILDENAEKLFETYKFLVGKIGVDTHAFQFLKGSPIQHADSMFNFEEISKRSHAYVYKKFEEIEKQLEEVRKYNIKNKRASFVHPEIVSLVSEQPLPNIGYINNEEHDKTIYKPCKFPWSSIHVNSDGEVFPCLAISMGNVKKSSLDEIISGEKFKNFRETIKKQGTVEACNRCGWLRPI